MGIGLADRRSLEWVKGSNLRNKLKISAMLIRARAVTRCLFVPQSIFFPLPFSLSVESPTIPVGTLSSSLLSPSSE